MTDPEPFYGSDADPGARQYEDPAGEPEHDDPPRRSIADPWSAQVWEGTADGWRPAVPLPLWTGPFLLWARCTAPGCRFTVWPTRGQLRRYRRHYRAEHLANR